MAVYEGVEINEVNLREHREAIHSVLSVSEREQISLVLGRNSKTGRGVECLIDKTMEGVC